MNHLKNFRLQGKKDEEILASSPALDGFCPEIVQSP
jgi:hypothetical protein